jgi:hypothetical protein
VGIVADSAIFYHRLMFKHKRSLFGGMTLETKIVYSFFGFEVCQKATMSLMTVTANHLTLFDGMVRRIQGLCANILVTIVTEFWLRLCQKPYSAGMSSVAIDTRNIVQGMLASLPIH